MVVDPTDDEPPYEQVRRRVAAAVATGSLPGGSRLPTVRGLADELGLAVNTVAKAYRALEADAVIETRGRRGTYVRSAVLEGDAAQAARRAARDYVADVRRLGLGRTEAQRLVGDLWD
ncbi:UNVERIFIED_CONTAM: GntR family transcriptional regulator [Mumia flava]